MALFPLFIDLENKDCLVIGGGEVALRKIEQLVKFNPRLTIIASKIHPKILALSVQYPMTLVPKEYTRDDIHARFLVIGALDDIEKQSEIFTLCTHLGIHVNCVDSPLLCTFIFPALIVEGDLCIGITTSGKAPALSGFLRRHLTKHIPYGIQEVIDRIHLIRRQELPGTKRQQKIIHICKAFFFQHKLNR